MADANWGPNDGTRKSQSGHVGFLAGAPVCVGSRRQKSVSLSTKEAEFYVIAFTIEAALVLRVNLRNLGFQIETPTVVFNDNQGVLMTFSDPMAEICPK